MSVVFGAECAEGIEGAEGAEFGGGGILVERASERASVPKFLSPRPPFTRGPPSYMHGSNLPLEAWGMALCILVTNLKGATSMKLHRDLGVTQKTAWGLAHRIRKTWEYDASPFSSPTEVNGTLHRRQRKEQACQQKAQGGAWDRWQDRIGITGWQNSATPRTSHRWRLLNGRL